MHFSEPNISSWTEDNHTAALRVQNRLENRQLEVCALNSSKRQFKRRIRQGESYSLFRKTDLGLHSVDLANVAHQDKSLVMWPTYQQWWLVNSGTKQVADMQTPGHINS